MSFELIETKPRAAIEAAQRHVISFYKNGKINLTTACSAKLSVNGDCYANFGVFTTDGLPKPFIFVTEEQNNSVFFHKVQQTHCSWYLTGTDKKLVETLAKRLSWKFPDGVRTRIRCQIDIEIIDHPFPGKKVFALELVES